MIVKPEDVNFIKLKLANNAGRTLKSLFVDRILMDHFVETWNECPLEERARFFNSVGNVLRTRLNEEAWLLANKMKKDHSISSYSSRSSNRIVADVMNSLSSESFSEGVLRDLTVVLSASDFLTDSLKETIRLLLSLSKKEIATLRDFTQVFQGVFSESCMGKGLLSGENFILTEDLYDDFVEEMNNFLYRKNSDGKDPQGSSIFGGINTVVLLLLIIIEDKVVDNLYYLRARMFPESPEIPYTILELHNRRKEKDEPIKILMSPPKERVISVVRPTLDNLKYIKLRKATQNINTTAFIDDRKDLNLVGAFYSLNVCQSKGLVNVEHILYANFMELNPLATKESLVSTSNQVRDYLISSPSKQDNQSHRSFHQREKLSFKQYEDYQRKLSNSFANANNMQSTSSRKSEYHEYFNDCDSAHSSSKDFNSPYTKPNQRFGSGIKRNERINQKEFRVFNQGSSNYQSGKGQHYGPKNKDRKQSAIYHPEERQPRIRDRFISNHVLDSNKGDMKPEEFDNFNYNKNAQGSVHDQASSKKKSLKATSTSYFHQPRPEGEDEQKHNPNNFREIDCLIKTYSLNFDETHSTGFNKLNRENSCMSETTSLTHFKNKAEDPNDDKGSKHSFGSSVNQKDASDISLHSPRTNGSTDQNAHKMKVSELDNHEDVYKVTKNDYFVYSGPDRQLNSQNPRHNADIHQSDFKLYSRDGYTSKDYYQQANPSDRCDTNLPRADYTIGGPHSERRDTDYLPPYEFNDRRPSQFDEFGNRKDTGFNVKVLQNLTGSSQRSSVTFEYQCNGEVSYRQDPYEVPTQQQSYYQESEIGYQRRNANLNFNFVYQEGPFAQQFKDKKPTTKKPTSKEEYAKRQPKQGQKK